MKMGKKGFTLIELIVVVIVVGILATIAIPQYLKATEKAKGAKAKSACTLIAQAEKLYRADQDIYIASATSSLGTDFTDYIELNQIDNDTDWSYTAVTADGTTQLTVTATRLNGTWSGDSIALDQDGVWTASSPGAGNSGGTWLGTST
jgi:prepilin-type N-terminal cleavage/methylation domain-containing protein